MIVLLVGGGGREHALGWKIAQSPQISKLYLAHGGPGLNPLGESLDINGDDPDAIVKAAREKSVNLVIVGPETPLAAGLADRLRDADIPCFGPSKAAAQLETSKGFMKDLCKQIGVPAADYGRFMDPVAAKAFLRQRTAPYVVKADGLAAGKGVIIAQTLPEADEAVDLMFAGEFGAAGAEVVIEDFMVGEEASFFVLTDGETIVPMIAAQDHKRVGEGDTGPNTGGMGAYSPTPIFSKSVYEQTMARIIEPTLKAMRDRGMPYCGVLYAGLMITDDGPKLIEYNVRFGDPECQVIMRRLKSDLLPVLYATATGTLAGRSLEWSDDAAALVVLAANGYPGAYDKGEPLKGIDTANALPGVVVFHAGTDIRNDVLVSAGGRVLNITATGATIGEAIERAYHGVDAIDWPGGFCRSDIGWRVLDRAP